jgi:hypothetical protein
VSDTTDPTIRLAALGGMTAETEAANPNPEDVQAAAAEQAHHAEQDAAAKQWGMLMFTIGGFAQMIAPELKAVYTEERCYSWGQQANAVGEKYGWNGPSAMPELALIASTAGFFVPTYFLCKARIKSAQDGTGPATMLSKLGLWWRTRKARAAAKATPAPTAEAEK